MVYSPDSLLWMLSHTYPSQFVIDDPYISNKHLRIYTIVYENEKPSEVGPLVYAEDLSRNGTYWNQTLIGKGNGGFLLTDGDYLRLSCDTRFSFQQGESGNYDDIFDLDQEKEMKKFCRDYIITDRLLGSGSFGKVFMAIEQFRRSQIACKVIDLRKLRPQVRYRIGKYDQPAPAEDVDQHVQILKVTAWGEQQKLEKGNRLEKTLKFCLREADILAGISHPNIVGLEKVFVTDNTIYIFQDLVTAGDLFSYLELKNGCLMDVEAAVIVRQILVALKFLHEKSVVHRDLKPDNILMTTLSTGCRVVLTDFGAARKISYPQGRMNSIVGTEGYIAPEMLNRQRRNGSHSGYTEAVDMWALGCVTVLLLTGGSAFTDTVTQEYSTRLAYECNLVSLENSSDWQKVGARPKKFVRRLLCLDEQTRLTAKAGLLDPWFNNEFHRTDFEELYQRTIKYWKPRIQKKPVIEFIDAHEVKWLQCSQDVLGAKKSRARGQTPVEPPYKPFPRAMHQPFFPRRTGRSHSMSEEVKAAIREYWSSSSESESEPDLPVLRKPISFSDTREVTNTTSPKPGHVPMKFTQPRKHGFKPLQRRAPSIELHTLENTLEKQAGKVAETTESLNHCCGVSVKPNAAETVKENKRPPTPRPRLAQQPNHGLPLRTLIDTGHHKNFQFAAVNRPLPSDHFNQPERARRMLNEEQPCPEDREWSGIEELPAECTSTPQTPTRHDTAFINSETARGNSKLNLGTPKSAVPDIAVATDLKKRRRVSVFDFEADTEDGVTDREVKRSRPVWQTAKMAFKNTLAKGKSSAERGLEETLVSRTPSPTAKGSGSNPVFLPRL